MTLYTVIPSPIDELTLVADDGVLSALFMLGHSPGPEPDTYARPANESEERDVFGETIRQLEQYFAGDRTDFTVPTAPRGTEFQRSVWQALTGIPYGQTRTYGQIAETIGKPKAVRAVGLANGKNPLSIIVPCHRVIGASGDLVGYGGGVERKRFLLDLESRQAALGV